ncbi:MATE family efflux transporter [Methanococcoides methylutens]|uniref:Multidrug export protein MepA n=1 Tax=Methanococcoides methylutens MM1 TaxID=1434104 RepID=A0A0E3WZQ6_METMT|nr:MATE family efflux transporter [Methanococcoides methylutens]AKB84504.1 Multi antimicrobial extrusion protein (Na(+)/drug antiporter), MATE family of MDR efflux pumps [Methanococcoides methylutens MM1]
MSEEELAVESVGKLFRKFTLPAVAGFIIGGIQIIIDGLFIGNGVGSLGLASVTLTYPLLIVMMSIALMAGIGCATLVALELGKGDRVRAHRVASDLLPIMVVIGAIFAIVGAFFTEPLLNFIGAKGEVFTLANEYLRIMYIGGIFFMIGMGLDPLVRNDGRPMFAMKMALVSAVTNIVLDYLFVMRWELGMQGAAFATVIAFAVSAIVFTAYFFSSHARLRLHLSDISPDLKIISGILKAGFPSFVMQMSLAILVMSYNFMLLKYGSEIAVSSYGVIEYSFSIFYMIFEGVSAGVQPIIGFNYGAKLYGRVYTAVRMAIGSCLAVGILGFVIMSTFPETIIQLFNRNDPELLVTAVEGMRIFMFGLMAEGVIISAGVYFQSVNKVRSSLFIHFGKFIVFVLPLLVILPMYYGLTGVWMANPLGQYMMFVFVAFMLVKERKFLLHPPVSSAAN